MGKFTNQISHQHKALFVSQLQIEETDNDMDWAFRKTKGSATGTHTEIVVEMRNIALDPQAWEARGLPSGKREEALAACNEWLEGIGEESVVHGEHE